MDDTSGTAGGLVAPHLSPEHFGCVVVHEAARGVVAWIRGPLDGETSPHMLRCLNRVFAQPLDRLTIDLADVPELDGDGLAALNAARRWAAACGVSITFDPAPPTSGQA